MFEPVKSIGMYQDYALDFMQGRHYGAIFLPMGTGKTYVMIEWMKKQKRDAIQAFPVLILAPKMVCHTWCDELRKFGNGLSWVTAYDGSVASRVAKVQELSFADITIANYETAPKLLGRTYRTVICDESTRIKNPKAVRSKAVYAIGQRATFRWILTGSPVPKGVEDIYGQIYFLDQGKLLGKNKWAFTNRFFSPVPLGNGRQMWTISNANVQRIREIVSPLTFYRKREDCISLPGKLRSVRSIPMSPVIREHTNHIKEYWRHEGREADNALTITAWLRMLCAGFAGDWNPIECGKYSALVELLGDFDLGRDRVVVWTWYTKEQDRVVATLQTDGYKVVAIQGKDPHHVRQSRLAQFERGEISICVISIATGAFGLNELANADAVIYFSNSYDLELRQQSEDRTYRAGRTIPCVYIDLVTEGSIEQHIADILRTKDVKSQSFLEAEIIRRMGLDHRPEKSNTIT